MTDKPGYRRPQAGTQPEYLHPTYQSTNLRSPSKPLVFLPHSLSEITGPTIGAERINEKDNDLTAQHEGQPQGCLLYTSPSPRDGLLSRMPSSA